MKTKEQLREQFEEETGGQWFFNVRDYATWLEQKLLSTPSQEKMAEVVYKILNILHEEKHGQGSFNRDEYKQRVITKIGEAFDYLPAITSTGQQSENKTEQK